MRTLFLFKVSIFLLWANIGGVFYYSCSSVVEWYSKEKEVYSKMDWWSAKTLLSSVCVGG